MAFNYKHRVRMTEWLACPASDTVGHGFAHRPGHTKDLDGIIKVVHTASIFSRQASLARQAFTWRPL